MPLSQALPVLIVTAALALPLRARQTQSLDLKQFVGPSPVQTEPESAQASIGKYAVRGRLIGLDGKSVAGASVEPDGISQSPGSMSWGGPHGVPKDKDGKFAFPLRAHGQTLYVSHPSGWAEESAVRGGEGFKLHLKPWAALSGTLIYSNGAPAAGVTLGRTVPSDWQRGEPHINVQGQTTTDGQGRFGFASVPPRRVEVQRIIPVDLHEWTSRLQTWLEAQPGITNDVGQVTYDQPPPLPALEQLKQRLGL